GINFAPINNGLPVISSDTISISGGVRDPQPLFSYPAPTIDTDIVKDSQGVYHLFFNTWGGKEGLQVRQSD
ncbi:MAG: hypothetical protein K2G33_06250, partial [Duncaniella sp.]|nr:hypothetical protein [Duncaniella sp.]